MKFLVRLIVNAAAIWLTAALLEGITLSSGDGQIASQLLVLGVVALVFTVVQTIVRPVVRILAIPLYILTLGLIGFVINALMLMLTGWISTRLGYGLEVASFWWALGGSIIISLIAWVLNLILPDEDREERRRLTRGRG